ncbi:MAG: hypothetical protein PF589_11635 [Gammaproteobacteria bacterium]|jgi:hypothetical protein|nr:hypothetical protein [Gammaproteobacteria bacterium]
MRSLVRLVAAVFSMLFFLQIQACSDMPTKEQSDSAEKVTEDKKDQSYVVEEEEPDCD